MRWLPGARLGLLLLLLGPLALGAQEDIPEIGSEPGESLRVFLMTMGRGDAIWERFGHNAIWIQDEATGQGAAYNWGIFDFGQVDFVPRLIRGTMLYHMAAMDPFASLEEYRRANRQVWIQELALTPSQRLELLAFVEWNALPENRDYQYDYYRDNCSTRVRDALNLALGGRIRAVSAADTTSYSYRWHTRRLLRDHRPAYLGSQFVLGPRADRPITAWEEMFLPERLMERLREVMVPDGEGGSRPLVVSERTLVVPDRPPEPDAPPLALPWFLLAGLLWGGGMFWFARRPNPWTLKSRLVLGVLAGGWALVAALGGFLLLVAWIFTDHVFWYGNWNLFHANPLFLILLLACVLFVTRRRFPSWGRGVAAVLAAVSLAGALAHLVPGLGQGGAEILALVVPLNLSLWLVSSRLRVVAGAGPPTRGLSASEESTSAGQVA